MRGFKYASPTTKEQAVALLGSNWGQTEVLAGGTDLLSLMKDRLSEPELVVNIKEIKELAGISYSASAGLRIGAVVTLQELLQEPTVNKEYPAIAHAARGVSSPQIRHAGTVGGDLCQRPRCWYFRNGMGLLAQDQAGRSLVPQGQNKYHAIFGNDGPAYFVNPSSLAPAIIALGAKVRVLGPKGSREIPAESFFVAPKTGMAREYSIAPNEIVTEILVPPSGGARSATYEIHERQLMDWPLATASVSLKMNGTRITSARVVLGHVAPVPWPSPEAEKALVGKTVSESVAAEAGAAAVSRARKLSQNGYKVQLAKVAVKRAILLATGGRA